MKYVYPAVFSEDGNSILVSIPDLTGCHTFADSLPEAIAMARDAMAMWLCIAEDKNESPPVPSKNLKGDGGFVSLIDTDTLEYLRLTDNREVKKTLSVPGWLNAKAELAGINFSAILQDGLKNALHMQ